MGWSRYSYSIVCLLCASLAGAEPKTWQLGHSGHWTESQTQPTTGPIANPILDNGQKLLDTNHVEAAHDVLLDWLLKNPKAPDRPRGILLMAAVYYSRGERMESFYQCDELLDNYPDSKLYFPALELQYRVADAYLSGYKNKFLGLSIISMEDSGIEMLFRIQERSPGSPLAERSLARSADYYYGSSQFDLAADAYGAFIRMYPRSPSVPQARMRQAYSNFAQFRGPRYDITPLLDARAQFLDIMAREPELARKDGVPLYIARIEEHLAARIYIDADYYQRVHQPKAAVYMYRLVIQQYPNSSEAQVARKAMAKMPASALTDPPPPQNAPQLPGPPVPATRPSFDVK